MDIVTVFVMLRLLRRRDSDDRTDDGGLDRAFDGVARFAWDTGSLGLRCYGWYVVIMLALTLIVGTAVTVWRWIAGN